MNSVVQLHQERPCNDVSATLRRIADKIEAGEHGEWPVTTCIVLIGHTDSDIPMDKSVLCPRNHWSTYAAGPRADVFTVRGLLATCSKEWGQD